MATSFSLVILVSLLAGMECRSIISSSTKEPIPQGWETPGASKREFSKDNQVSSAVDDYMKNLTNFDNRLVETSDGLDVEELRRFVAIQGLNLEKILANFAARTVDLKEYEERTAQWLRLLKQMLQSSGRYIEKSRQADTRFNDVDEIETVLIDGDKKIIPFDGYNWLGNLLEFLDEQDIDGQSSDDNESHVKTRYEDSSTSFSLVHENSEEHKDDRDASVIQGPEEFDNMLVGVRNEIDRIREYFEKLCSKHHLTSSTTRHIEEHNHDHVKKISKS